MMNPEINSNIISKDKLKDVLLTKTAINTLKPVSIVEKVINHTFKEAVNALRTNPEVEISGFGVFKTNRLRAELLIKKKENQIKLIERKLKEKEFSESAIKNYNNTIAILQQDIKNLNCKLKNQTDEN